VETMNNSPELIRKGNFYYKVDNEDMRYCTRCYDSDKELITVDEISPVYGVPTYKCPKCNKTNQESRNT